jgi:hypothetical protein
MGPTARGGGIGQKRQVVAEEFDWDTTDVAAGALGLWVPETLHTSCNLLILVDQPTEPVASLNVVNLGGGVVGEWS